MNRLVRTPLRLATRITFALFAAALSAGRARAAPPDGPVVIFLVDTLRHDRMSVYGGPHATTPAADRLAREAIVFEHAYSLSSWTRASVGTLFTSLLPAAAGTLDRNGKLDPAVATLPQLFHDRGWLTAAFVGNPNVSPTTGLARGFTVFEAVNSAETGYEGHPHARAIVDPAIRFVESQTSRHFFLYVHVLDPHLPFNLEPAYRTLFASGPAGRQPTEREALFLDYDRTIRQADDQFARLAAALRAKDFWDGATVVYTSDHGEEFYEHGGRGHGRTLYEEQIRVPLLVKLPAESGKSARRHDLVSLADVAPTLAGLHALPREASWIGSDLLAPLPERSLYFTEDLDGDRLFALRAGAKKLVVRLYPKLDERVFDLAGDAGEKLGREIACGAAPPDDARALLSASETWRARDVASFPRIELEKGGESFRFLLVMSLPDDPHPFLTTDATCRYAALVRGSAFTLAAEVPVGQPFRLSIAADQRGEVPPYRLTVFDADGNVVSGARRDSLLRMVRVERPIVRGESEDEIRKLRNLGYLGGP